MPLYKLPAFLFFPKVNFCTDSGITGVQFDASEGGGEAAVEQDVVQRLAQHAGQRRAHLVVVGLQRLVVRHLVRADQLRVQL